MVVKKVGFVVDLGMAFVDNLVVGKEKGCYWLSNDIVWLVGSFHVGTTIAAWVSPSFSSFLFAPIFSFIKVG